MQGQNAVKISTTKNITFYKNLKNQGKNVRFFSFASCNLNFAQTKEDFEGTRVPASSAFINSGLGLTCTDHGRAVAQGEGEVEAVGVQQAYQGPGGRQMYKLMSEHDLEIT